MSSQESLSPKVAKHEEPGTITTVAYALIIALFIRALLFEPFNIPSVSMVPGLKVGDFLFVSKFSYGFSSLSTSWGLLPFEGRLGGQKPKRGDVVVFKLPTDTGTNYIKRLVGMPGDEIEVRDSVVYINGNEVKRYRIGPMMLESHDGTPTETAIEYAEINPEGREYRIVQEYTDGPLDNYGPVKIPQGHYFMMGDNRNNSSDSRTKIVGMVPAENLVGRAEFTFLSLDADTKAWQFWKWPFSVRFDRMFKKIK